MIGANGTGKSSLLKVIAGLQKPLKGKVTVNVPRRGGLSFLPQQRHPDRQFPISACKELVRRQSSSNSPRNKCRPTPAAVLEDCASVAWNIAR